MCNDHEKVLVIMMYIEFSRVEKGELFTPKSSGED